ncbi:uncharacterized protein LOC108847174 [Raphanus sativus]|uniref:Uncharacterized protein LOC108847174 n=1 Tax=Raphanus sativus TaxID=3726 RepID=A0A6J0MTT2_RAPSA|nr:uncharacterized protein LOC108847174 [Raphanus sativus]
MYVAMDRALMALSLEDEEEEVPFTMQELTGFSSAEENALSIMGRALNHECQKMSSLILIMPRMWQKEGRVRGVALSQERFQFIFQHEYDLFNVRGKRISKIPVNYYIQSALTTLGEMIGAVKVVSFDRSKPITQDFNRVQVRFNVAKPLKMARVLNMGAGKSHTIHFDYEKLQKRCFTCKRLNHEESILPCLEEAQVGTDPLTGRPKISKEVLEEMRRFLISDMSEDLTIKIDKVKRSVREAESNPILRLESVPIITADLNKGKGSTFEYAQQRRQEMTLKEASTVLCLTVQRCLRLVLRNLVHPGQLARKRVNVRRRPPRAQRQRNQLALLTASGDQSSLRREGKQEVGSRKRKKTEEGAEVGSINKAQCLQVVPHEGSPSSQ